MQRAVYIGLRYKGRLAVQHSLGSLPPVTNYAMLSARISQSRRNRTRVSLSKAANRRYIYRVYDCGTDRVAAVRDMTLVDTEKRTTATFADLAVNGLLDEILLVADIFTLAKQFVATAIDIVQGIQGTAPTTTAVLTLTDTFEILGDENGGIEKQEKTERALVAAGESTANTARIHHEKLMRSFYGVAVRDGRECGALKSVKLIRLTRRLVTALSAGLLFFFFYNRGKLIFFVAASFPVSLVPLTCSANPLYWNFARGGLRKFGARLGTSLLNYSELTRPRNSIYFPVASIARDAFYLR